MGHSGFLNCLGANSYEDHPGDLNFPARYRNLLHHWVHQEDIEIGYRLTGAAIGSDW
jgi:hypothetical protein